MLDNDVNTLEAKPMWLPWFTVDGVPLVDAAKQPEVEDKDGNESLPTSTLKEGFLLGKKVCDAYVKKSGKKAPAGCASLPQSVADIPEDPYAHLKQKDFTSLIEKIEKKKAEILEQQNEAKLPWYEQSKGQAFMAIAALPVFGVAAWSTFHSLYKKRFWGAAQGLAGLV